MISEKVFREAAAGTSHWRDEPVATHEEVMELVASCLWDVFSDNHDVIAADGRTADIGSFRGAAGFLVEYLTGPNDDLWSMDYCRIYLGTIWISGRADLTPVYAMIFHRLQALGADWEYHFPQLSLVDLSPLRGVVEPPKPGEYSPSEAFGKEQEERERQAELERFRAELAERAAQARRAAMDLPPPATVRAYQTVYGRDLKKAGHQCSGARRIDSPGAKCGVEARVFFGQSMGMKTVTIQYPDQLDEQLRKLVAAGWFKTPEEGVVEALRRYLSGHSVELQEQQILEDVEWGLHGRD